MQASVVMHNQLNVFMTVPSLFPNEEFLKPCMVVDVWQAPTSIHWVCQSELRVLEMLICTFHEANMHRRKSLLGVIHHITSCRLTANVLWNKTVKVFVKIHNENTLFGIMN